MTFIEYKIINNYTYAHWSNYILKCIEHVHEVIETDDTLGGLSGEGNEAGNKNFRHLLKNHSRKGCTPSQCYRCHETSLAVLQFSCLKCLKSRSG